MNHFDRLVLLAIAIQQVITTNTLGLASKLGSNVIVFQIISTRIKHLFVTDRLAMSSLNSITDVVLVVA